MRVVAKTAGKTGNVGNVGKQTLGVIGKICRPVERIRYAGDPARKVRVLVIQSGDSMVGVHHCEQMRRIQVGVDVVLERQLIAGGVDFCRQKIGGPSSDGSGGRELVNVYCTRRIEQMESNGVLIDARQPLHLQTGIIVERRAVGDHGPQAGLPQKNLYPVPPAEVITHVLNIRNPGYVPVRPHV